MVLVKSRLLPPETPSSMSSRVKLSLPMLIPLTDNQSVLLNLEPAETTDSKSLTPSQEPGPPSSVSHGPKVLPAEVTSLVGTLPTPAHLEEAESNLSTTTDSQFLTETERLSPSESEAARESNPPLFSQKSDKPSPGEVFHQAPEDTTSIPPPAGIDLFSETSSFKYSFTLLAYHLRKSLEEYNIVIIINKH
jgi:hypothetical protein